MGKDNVCVKMQQLDPGFSGSKQVSVKEIIMRITDQLVVTGGYGGGYGNLN